MADLSPLRQNIQIEATRFRTSVSESQAQYQGQAINFINNRQHQDHKFVTNGKYGNIPGVQLPFKFLDGVFQFEFDAEITNLRVFCETIGTSGTTEIDVKRATTSGGAFSSIMAITPKITTAASAKTFFGSYDITEGTSGLIWTPNATPPTGVTPGTFSGGAPFNVNAGDAICVDLIDRMVGAQGLCVTIKFRQR